MRDSLGADEGGLARPGRRTLLRGLAGGALAGLTAGAAAGCEIAPEAVGGSPVRTENGTISGGGIRDTDWALARPRGSDTVPVCVVLHGKGGHVGQVVGGGLQVEDVLADLLDEGAAPFAVAGVSGGNGYWHARADGTDSGALVTDHLLPELEHHGIDTTRIAFLGWSMGGYGSLLLAGRLGRRRVAAVAAESSALWFSAGQAAPGAFDDAEDYEEHLVMGRQEDLRGIPVRLDCGESDPFYAANRAYAKGFDEVETHFGPGGHTLDYWAERTPSQLAWIGRHLTARG